MQDINRVIISGNIGGDLLGRTTKDGIRAVEFDIASSKFKKDKATGQREKLTNWNTVFCMGKMAEYVERTFKKGMKVFIEGEIVNGSYVDKDSGKKIKTFKLRIAQIGEL